LYYKNEMLGDLIYEGEGKTTGRRVIGMVAGGGQSLEISMSGKGPTGL
jgi:hypothetical protein